MSNKTVLQYKVSLRDVGHMIFRGCPMLKRDHTFFIILFLEATCGIIGCCVDENTK